jgi:hypothetical protein
MWAQLIKVATLGKGALVVGIAASAAMVSNAAELPNTPSHNELPSPTAAATASPTAPASSPSPFATPKVSEAPSASPKHTETAPGLVRECVSKYTALRADGDNASHGDRESTTAVCKAAIEQSGLTTAEFAAKYGLITLPTVPVASPKTETKDVGLSDAIKQCLADWRNYAETTSAACARALAASGLSPEDFWRKFEEWAAQQPQDSETVTDVTALVKDCFAKYTAKDPTTLEACKKAMAASGLSGDDFWNKFGRPTPPSATPPSATPKSSTSDATYQLIATCIKLHSALTSTSEPARVTAAYDACNKAIAATGLTATEFWAKFAKELASVKPSPTATPKPVTNTAEVSLLIARCLELYKGLTTTSDTKAVSDACKAAILASGMTSAEFAAKYLPATH